MQTTVYSSVKNMLILGSGQDLSTLKGTILILSIMDYEVVHYTEDV